MQPITNAQSSKPRKDPQHGGEHVRKLRPRLEVFRAPQNTVTSDGNRKGGKNSDATCQRPATTTKGRAYEATLRNAATPAGMMAPHVAETSVIASDRRRWSRSKGPKEGTRSSDRLRRRSGSVRYLGSPLHVHSQALVGAHEFPAIALRSSSPPRTAINFAASWDVRRPNPQPLL